MLMSSGSTTERDSPSMPQESDEITDNFHINAVDTLQSDGHDWREEAGNAVSREDLPPTPPVSATSSRAGSGAKDAISSKTPSVRPSMLRSNSLPSGSHAATAAAGFSRSPHVPGGAIEEDFKLLIKKTCSRSKDLYFC
eukprot:TRINITY_DN37679_c0_g2_i5.p1 TRINITY_DN37679_c0_g2~~TRINITY_DN37679_c0_g2_i5.p1  ORF type:complete len:139 (+),score=20.92 TRINITY_DN37679_c0_g2_i5:483-899(+)